MFDLQRNVELSAATTLQLGGPAAELVDVGDEADVPKALEWAHEHDREVFVLGGGSNVVIADEGLDGLVLRIANRGVEVQRSGDRVRVRVSAGEPWDDVVARACASGFRGIECLSGIPGLAGATPIQNVGAYGQEVGQVLMSVRAFDREVERIVDLSPRECELSYRDSALRKNPARWIVLGVELELCAGGEPEIAYAELERALGDGPRTPARVRDVVISLRRGKSMVIDPSDPNRRSAGSFFTNPIVAPEVADDVAARASARGVDRAMPRWPMDDGRVKLAAGWLIEGAGFRKGMRSGAVGLSSAHALAVVHHGGGTTAELLKFARTIRDGVRDAFGVELRPEPVLLGVEF